MGNVIEVVLSLVLLALAAAAVAGAMMWGLDAAGQGRGANEDYRPQPTTAQGMHHFDGTNWTAHDRGQPRTRASRSRDGVRRSSGRLGVIVPDPPPGTPAAGGDPVHGDIPRSVV